MIQRKFIRYSIIVFLPAFFFATNYTLNHFYVNGGYMLDSGWFAYLSSYSTNWPAGNLPALGGSYFSTHFSPVFYLFTIIFKLLSLIGLIEFSTSWFALLQGFWFGLMAMASFILLSNKPEPVSRKTITWTCITSLLLAFNGAALATIGFPHFEIAIPALLITFFAAYSRGHLKLAFLFLGLGLLVREDAGLHYLGVFFLISIYYFLFDRAADRFKKAIFFLILTAVCLTYSLSAICIQKFLFSSGDNALARIYLGDPPLSHLSASFLKKRITFVLSNRLYIIVPLLLTLFLSVQRKNKHLLIGACAVTPWIVFSLTGITVEAGTLSSYYAFPVIIGLLWPAVSFSIFGSDCSAPLPAGTKQTRLIDVFLIAIVSITFFHSGSGNHDRSPWKNFTPKWIGKIESAHLALDSFFQSNPKLKLIFDDAAACLLNHRITPLEWQYQLKFSKDELQNIDAILFQPGTWTTGIVKEIARNQGYTQLYYLKNAHFAILSRRTDIKGCSTPKPIDNTSILTTTNYFDNLPGWSHKEPGGRWTIGDEVLFPAIRLAIDDKLCIKGHAFLPEKSSTLVAEVFFADQLIGTFQYDSSAPDGERCLRWTDKSMNGQPGPVKMQITGFSSPSAHGLSVDTRKLGIFVTKIYVKKQDALIR